MGTAESCSESVISLIIFFYFNSRAFVLNWSLILYLCWENKRKHFYVIFRAFVTYTAFIMSLAYFIDFYIKRDQAFIMFLYYGNEKPFSSNFQRIE